MKITLSPPKEKISIKGIWSRLCVHIFYQMLISALGGIIALKGDTKSIIVFILVVISSGVSIVVAFLDKSAAEYAKEVKEQKEEAKISGSSVTTVEDDQSGEDEQYG